MLYTYIHITNWYILHTHIHIMHKYILYTPQSGEHVLATRSPKGNVNEFVILIHIFSFIYTFKWKTCSRSHEVWAAVTLDLWLVCINTYKCIYYPQIYSIHTSSTVTLDLWLVCINTYQDNTYIHKYIPMYVLSTNIFYTHLILYTPQSRERVLPHTKPERQCHSVRDSYIYMFIYIFINDTP